MLRYSSSSLVGRGGGCSAPLTWSKTVGRLLFCCYPTLSAPLAARCTSTSSYYPFSLRRASLNTSDLPGRRSVAEPGFRISKKRLGS